MAEDARCRVRASGNFFKIGATDTASVNFEQDFFRSDFWDCDRFQADIAYTAIHGGLHGGWYGFCGVFDCELSGDGHYAASDSMSSKHF
jgi:hypothetical protein